MIDKVGKPQWERAGAKDALKRAREHVDKILKEHYPKPLPSDVEQELDSFMTRVLKKQK